MMWMVKLLGRMIVLPMLPVLMLIWIVIRFSMSLLNLLHGLFWILLMLMGVLAIANQMWPQLGQIILWAVISLILVNAGAVIEVTVEALTGRLAGFILHA